MEEYVYEEERHSRWWPFLLFIILVIIGVATFFFTGDNGDLRSPGVSDTGCVVMQDRGDYENSINIVFLGTEYEDVEEFRTDTDRFMHSFLNTVPHNEYKDRFNFFRLESFDSYGCKYEDAVICNPQEVQKESVKCPGQDLNVVLVGRSKVDNFFKHLRSSAWLTLASINSADDPLVLSHEAAHVLYDFADEYVYGGTISWDAPNCDSEIYTCPKFSSVDGSECVIGCVNEQNSRPAEYDIMSNYWKSSRYEVYNEWWISNFLEENTIATTGKIKTEGSPKLSPQKSYLVELNCTSEGDCGIVDVQYSPNRYPTTSKLIDSDTYLLYGDYKVNIPSSGKIFTDHGPDGDVLYLPYSITVAIPFEEDEKEIGLYTEDKLKESYSLNLDESSGRTGISAKILNIPEVN